MSMNITVQDEPDVQPRSKRERLLPPSALEIVEAEAREKAKSGATSYAHRQGQELIRRDIAELYMTARSNENAPKPSKKLAAQTEAAIEAGHEKLRANDALYEEAKRLVTGSAETQIEDWILHDLKGPHRAVNTVVTLAEGESVQAAMDTRRDKSKALKTKRTAIIKAPQPEDDARARIKAAVDRSAAKLAHVVGPARFVSYHERDGSFRQRDIRMPQITISGDSILQYVGDGLGVLCALFPNEVYERLCAIALANHDEAAAMTMADRRAALAEVDTELLRIGYESEAIIRLARGMGQNVGPRITSNVLCILDIEPE
ncbi:hypothetical protein IVB30_05085 [Bradyrhizobium sp. 200]|uniref:hypothetical protein n=1 Tax=Bradyrhizobium sp. 200 TaxID=2782665 RepID=UPI001FFF9F94|nr:hypothetical protein [Bradyrhizobium sp. 200]UPJ50778.1 hypothetical protein IVB30_05085 [Bradyrhizobium sp. 200]